MNNADEAYDDHPNELGVENTRADIDDVDEMGGKKHIKIKGIVVLDKKYSKPLNICDFCGSSLCVVSALFTENTILIYQKITIEKDVVPTDKKKNVARKTKSFGFFTALKQPSVFLRSRIAVIMMAPKVQPIENNIINKEYIINCISL
ncbi:4187_t:CDS:2 [Dentiscutata erythropus]|uniref:4187_t:CDS:1 n=1 Tax=Dentiscutata erythropus TaxID=1348616 RepID=A0A9N8VDZ0_9GLOM|nr:4187_t:CDS:2 [Dentiscutata erythropus]